MEAFRACSARNVEGLDLSLPYIPNTRFLCLTFFFFCDV